MDDLSQQQHWATEIPILRQCKQWATVEQWRDWQGFSGRIRCPFVFWDHITGWQALWNKSWLSFRMNYTRAGTEWEWQTQTRLFTTNIHPSPLLLFVSSWKFQFNFGGSSPSSPFVTVQSSWSGWLAGKSCSRKNENISQGGLFSVVWRGLEPVELRWV